MINRRSQLQALRDDIVRLAQEERFFEKLTPEEKQRYLLERSISVGLGNASTTPGITVFRRERERAYDR